MAVSPDAPMHSQSTDPPRAVPFSLRVRVVLGGWGQGMWFFLGLYMYSVWVFVPNADLSQWTTFRGPLQTARGTVTAIEKTGFAEDGREHKLSHGPPIYRYRYEFDTGGQTFRGASYHTGEMQDVTVAAAGAVTVEFPQDQPQHSRIQGMRADIFEPRVMLILLFPLGLAVALFFALRGGRRNVHLLQNGLLTTAALVSKEGHYKTWRGSPHIYNVTFEFQDTQGQPRTITYVAPKSKSKLYEDQPQQPVLYDPLNERRAVLLDALPGRPRIAADGTLQSSSPQWDWLVLLLPAAVILGHGWYFVRHVL